MVSSRRQGFPSSHCRACPPSEPRRLQAVGQDDGPPLARQARIGGHHPKGGPLATDGLGQTRHHIRGQGTACIQGGGTVRERPKIDGNDASRAGQAQLPKHRKPPFAAPATQPSNIRQVTQTFGPTQKDDRHLPMRAINLRAKCGLQARRAVPDNLELWRPARKCGGRPDQGKAGQCNTYAPFHPARVARAARGSMRPGPQNATHPPGSGRSSDHRGCPR